MIIQCPSCERRFDLQRKAPETFCCPKCGYSVPFINILNAEKDTDVVSPSHSTFAEGQKTTVFSDMGGNQKTKMIPELQPDNNMETRIVQELQQPKGAILQILENSRPVKNIPLRPGHQTIGRQSSDSKATLKIAPDIAMSRIHAYLATVQKPGTPLQYILKPANQNNPIFINNRPVVYGTAALLRPGDIIVMGNTTMTFRIL